MLPLFLDALVSFRGQRLFPGWTAGELKLLRKLGLLLEQQNPLLVLFELGDHLLVVAHVQKLVEVAPQVGLALQQHFSLHYILF